MPDYILNRRKQDSASRKNHELHDVTPGACDRLPAPENRIDIGFFSNCHAAIDAARRKHPSMSATIDGCHQCCPECHRG
jgi:hypothetical protein